MRSVQLSNALWLTLFVPFFRRRQVVPDRRGLLENPKTHHRPRGVGVSESEQVMTDDQGVHHFHGTATRTSLP
jgi:hypothetical protein